MYMNRNEGHVTLGRADEYEATIEQWSVIQAQNDGFVGATALQSYAYPGRYTLFSRWVDREAWVAATRREAFKTFARDLIGSGLVRPTRMTESYESVLEVNRADADPSHSFAERFVDLMLNAPQHAPALESRLHQLGEIVLKHAPGVLSVRLRRSFGDDRKYLMLVITTDRAAARDWLLIPEVRAFTESQSGNAQLAAPPAGEIHRVIKRYAGPALAAMSPELAAATRSP
jgi:heme-degrading monooxygenase HmoA